MDKSPSEAGRDRPRVVGAWTARRVAGKRQLVMTWQMPAKAQAHPSAQDLELHPPAA